MANALYPKGFFETTLSSAINATTTTIPLVAVPTGLTEGYMVIEPTSASKREVIYFTSVGGSSVTSADDTTDGSDASGRGCSGSITVGGNTAHDQGASVIISAVEQYWKRIYNKFTGNDTTVLVDTNGNEILKVSQVSSAVNEITIINAATGNFPTIQATGEADTGIDIENSEGEEIIKLDAIASAVNEITVKNSATGVNPSFNATGDDTNIGIDLQAKGTGVYRLLGTADTAAEIRLFEDTDNGTNYIGLKAPASAGSNITFTLPSADGSSGHVLQTNGSGTLSFTAATGAMTDAGNYVKPTTDGDEIRAYHSDTTSYIEIGNNGTDSLVTSGVGHLVLTPASNKLVKFSVLRQNAASDSYKNNCVMLTGFHFEAGNGSTAFLPTGGGTGTQKTFGITFSVVPIVLISNCGYKDGSDPSDAGDFTGGAANLLWGAQDVDTTGFKVYGQTIDASSVANGRRIGYHWIAVGEL